MPSLRRWLTLLVVAMLTMTAAACGSSDDDTSTSGTQEASADSGGTQVEGGKGTLGVVAIDLQNAFFVRMKEAGDKAAADYGVKTTWQSAQGSVEKQISIVENMVRQGVGAILIDPLDKNAIKPAIAKATAAGIPVISMGNKVDGDGNYNTLYPDYDNMAANARVLAKSIDEEGQVGLLVGSRGNFVSDTREAGFVETMKKEFPNVDVVSVQPTDFDASKAADIATTWSTSNPDMKGFACISDSLCLAAQSALQSAGKDLKFVGVDGDEEMHPFLESGQMVMDVLTGAERVGYWNIAVGARLVNGAKLPKDLFLPTFFVSASDIPSEVGLETITPDDATSEAQGYQDQFGPDQPDSAMTTETK
ncbi:MAG TPA: sugar ABC transporter substrate-binding protein [Capillimicrobium sp.]|nr:sugar ABC transporter substrate-binding protein [Capillimicrobium sp.]